jgi:hypothetical protein
MAFRVRKPADSLPQTLGYRFCGACFDFSCHQIAAGPIHAGQKVSFTAFADNGITFPIAEPLAFISFFRPLVNGAFSQDLAPSGRFAVGLTAGLSGYPKERTEPPGSLWITPNPAIDRGMADGQTLQS